MTNIRVSSSNCVWRREDDYDGPYDSDLNWTLDNNHIWVVVIKVGVLIVAYIYNNHKWVVEVETR